MAKSKTRKYKGKELVTACVPNEDPASSSATVPPALSTNSTVSKKTRVVSLEKRPAEPLAEPSSKRAATVKEPERAKHVLEVSSATSSSILAINDVVSEKTRAVTVEKRSAEPIAEPSTTRAAAGNEPERAEHVLGASTSTSSFVLPANNAVSKRTRAANLEKRSAELIAEPSAGRAATENEPESAEHALEERRKELEYILLNHSC